MKKNSRYGITVLAAGVMGALLLSSCEITVTEEVPVDAVHSISGTVVNVRSVAQTDKPASGRVEARVFGEPTAAATGFVNSTGTYTIPGLKPGSYLVTYEDTNADDASDWFGVPVSVSVGEGDVTNVGALVFKGVAADSVLLIATWTNSDYDIDSYSMVGPEGSAAQVYWSAPTLNAGGNIVELERDVDETAITAGTYTAETTLVSGLATGTELRFFVKLYSLTSGSITGLDDGDSSEMPAGVTVYAMYQESATVAMHFGTWFAPLNTAEDAVGMVSMIGNADGTLTVGSFGVNFAAPATPRSATSGYYGVPVSDIR